MARTRLVVAYIKVMDHERELTRGDIAEFMREITNREAAIGAREEELNERKANICEETEGVREQILAALRETEERNKILKTQLAALKESLEGRISQQSNAGGARIGDGERNIEHCEIVKQSATPARKSSAGTLPDGSNLRGTQTKEVSGARQNAASMSERDRGSIFERINEMRRSVHGPRQRTERVRNEPDILKMSLTFRLKEAINSVPKFDGSNLSGFVRSCKRAASLVPPALEAELVNMLKSKLHESTFIAVEDIYFDSSNSFVDRLKSVFAPTETLNNLRGRLDAITKRRDETMLAYVNRIIDIRDGMVDLKRREGVEVS